MGIIAYGESLKEAFENSAYGMFSLMCDPEKVTSRSSFDIKARGDDRESLLVAWLNELIFLEDTKRVLLKEFNISELSDKELKAKVVGEEIDPQRHLIQRSVKAATYNQLLIEEKGGKWRTRVVFDV